MTKHDTQHGLVRALVERAVATGEVIGKGGIFTGSLSDLYTAADALDAALSPLAIYALVEAFVDNVNKRAEFIMEQTGTVSGAHWNAMRQVLAETKERVGAL